MTILPIRPADERIDQYGNVIEPRFPVTIGVEVRSPTDAPPAAESASVTSDDAGLGRGYQTTRVTRALDRLENAGLKLDDYTDPELRRLVSGSDHDREARTRRPATPGPIHQRQHRGQPQNL